MEEEGVLLGQEPFHPLISSIIKTDTTMKKDKKKVIQERKQKQGIVSNSQQVKAPIEEDTTASWEDFEKITKGDFRKLLGCG